MAVNSSAAPKRFCYRIEKAGHDTMFGYLFDDNVRYWISQGWTVTLNHDRLT